MENTSSSCYLSGSFIFFISHIYDKLSLSELVCDSLLIQNLFFTFFTFTLIESFLFFIPYLSLGNGMLQHLAHKFPCRSMWTTFESEQLFFLHFTFSILKQNFVSSTFNFKVFSVLLENFWVFFFFPALLRPRTITELVVILTSEGFNNNTPSPLQKDEVDDVRQSFILAWSIVSYLIVFPVFLFTANPFWLTRLYLHLLPLHTSNLLLFYISL